MKYFRAFGLLFLKGMGVGVADLIPGVSGGTVALILGIYEDLLQALQSFDMKALRLLNKGHFSALWQHVQGDFLLPLVLGIGVSLLTTVQLVTYLLSEYSIQTWSFFLGLLFISTLMIYQKIRHWQLQTTLVSLLGFILAYGVTQAPPLQTPNTSLFLVLCGVLAACAMLLPGISGSFVLVLLGKYAFMLQALQDFQLTALAPFAVGVVVGLLSCSRGIAWLLRRQYDTTLALLAGFMLGSLNKVWPWQYSWGALTGGSFAMTQNLSPRQFQAIYQQDPLLAEALLWASLGILVVVLLERQVRQSKQVS